MVRRLLLLFSFFLAFDCCAAHAGATWSRALAEQAAKGDRGALEAALRDGLAPDAADPTGKTLLMTAAQEGQVELVALLLFRKAGVDFADRQGKTPLMYACAKGQEATANILLQGGANPNAADRFGKTVLEYAAASKNRSLVALLISCGAQAQDTGEQGFAKELGAEGYYKVTVHYATNRQPLRDGAAGSLTGFANTPGDRLNYGTCEVSIPKNHLPGELEGPVPFFSYDPSRHVTLLGLQPEQEAAFYRHVKQLLKQHNANDVLIFIHGYNVSFQDAARRTAQLSFDLDFKGAPMFFSWPSNSSLLGYRDDKKRIEDTVPLLKQYLRTVASEFKDANINIIAHSMGTYGFTTALKELAEEMAAAGEKPRFKEIILAAPDIDAEQFRNKIAPMIGPTASRLTLYASSKDLALIISNFVNNGQRAGDSSPEVVVNSGVETIDVSQVDTSLLGHSYYGSNSSVVGDIKAVIENQQPEKRSLDERKQAKEARRYWFFNPLKKSKAAAAPSGS